MNIEETPSGSVLVGGTPITNVSDVRNLIKRLQNMEKNMTTGGERNKENDNISDEDESNKPPDSDFSSLTLLDLETFNTLPEDSWLLDVKEIPGVVKKDTKRKDNMLDSRLLSIRNSLVNSVKAALNEDRASQVNVVRLKRNASYIIHRDQESPERHVQMLQSPKRAMDVSASYTYRVPKSRNSPAMTFLPNIDSDLEINDISPITTEGNGTSHLKSVKKTPTKYATVTRPHKTGLPLVYTPIDLDEHYTRNGDNSDIMNATYICTEDDNSSRALGNEKLNTTFVRPYDEYNGNGRGPASSENDEVMSSPSDSNHSPHNISMEELQTKARIQEQSLRMVPLRRKDTHVIEYNSDINGQMQNSPSRTWSTDTYSVAESNPDSGASSGVSSPRDSQSYENVLVPTSVRRSMPNLALVKDANRRKTSTALQTVPKCQPQYISDSKLDDGRSRTKVIGSINPNSNNRRHSNQYQYSSQEQESTSTQMKKPVYTRGETFYKSTNNSGVLPSGSQTSIDSYGQQGIHTMQYNPQRPNTAANISSAQRYPIDVSQDKNNGMVTNRTFTTSRPSTQVGNSSGISQLQKPKISSRIPAPGGRLRQF